MRFKFLLGASTALALMMSLFMSSANAESSRFGIGIAGGAANFDTSGTETEGSASDTSTRTANESAGVPIANFFIEYAGRFDTLGLTVGLNAIPGDHTLGKRSRTDTVSDSNEDSDDSGTYTAKANVSEHVGIYLEPTYYFPGTEVGLYVKGGMLRTTVDSLESIDVGEDSSAYGDETIYGKEIGVGIRARHESGFFYKIEYSETDYDTIDLTSTTGNSNKITADVDSQKATLSIGYSF